MRRIPGSAIRASFVSFACIKVLQLQTFPPAELPSPLSSFFSLFVAGRLPISTISYSYDLYDYLVTPSPTSDVMRSTTVFALTTAVSVTLAAPIPS